jgi:hypothetical protein
VAVVADPSLLPDKRRAHSKNEDYITCHGSKSKGGYVELQT